MGRADDDLSEQRLLVCKLQHRKGSSPCCGEEGGKSPKGQQAQGMFWCSWWRSNRSGGPKGAWLTERPREGLLPISPHNTRKRTIWVGVQASERTFYL